MAVKVNDVYKHWGNRKKYKTIAIALPFNVAVGVLGSEGSGKALHTENEKHIRYFSDGNIYYTECDEYLVLYQRQGENTVYARPVDMFFEHVDGEIRRFTKQ